MKLIRWEAARIQRDARTGDSTLSAFITRSRSSCVLVANRPRGGVLVGLFLRHNQRREWPSRLNRSFALTGSTVEDKAFVEEELLTEP